MKLITTTFLLLWAFTAHAQTSLCQRDSITAYGHLLIKILEDSKTGVTITHPNLTEEYNVTRICQHSYKTIDSLDQLLTDQQVEQLLRCEDTALKSVAFLLYCKRNDKTQVMNKFCEFLNERTGFIYSDCSSAKQITTFQQYCFEMLTHKKMLYRPLFLLTEKEQSWLAKELLIYKQVYWQMN